MRVSRTAWGVVLHMIAAIMALSLFAVTASGAAQTGRQKGEIRGLDMGGYGRIILQLEDLPQSSVALNNAILVWSFDRPITLRVDALPVELTRYIAGARLDPDGKTLRLALAQSVRFNLQDAGNDFYLDLLPPSWTSANPPIPADIVRDLSRRLRETQAELRNRDALLETPLSFESGEGPALSLVRIASLDPSAVKVLNTKNDVQILINGRYRFDAKAFAAVLPKEVRLVTAVQEKDIFRIQLDIGQKIDMRSHFDDRVLVIAFQSRKSGSLDVDDLDMMRRGEWTGSTQDPEAGEHAGAQPHAANTIRITRQDTDDVIEMDMIQDVPFANFIADGKLFLLIATDQPFTLSDDRALATASSDRVTPIGSAGMKGFVFPLKFGLLPVIEKTPRGYRITMGKPPDPHLENYDFVPAMDSRDQARVIVSFADATRIFSVDDPETGASYLVAPSGTNGLGMRERRVFQEFALEASARGLAIRKFADDVTVTADAGAVVISRPSGLLALTREADENGPSVRAGRSIIKTHMERLDPAADILTSVRAMTDTIIAADAKEKGPARIRLARFYAAHGLFREAAAMLERAYSERMTGRLDPQDEIELVLYRALGGDNFGILARLAEQDMTAFPDGSLISAFLLAQNGQMNDAIAAYRTSGSVLASYPSVYVRRILPVLAEAAIEAQDQALAGNLVTALAPYVDDPMRDRFRYLSARYLALTGQHADADAILNDLAGSDDRAVSVRARLALLTRDDAAPPEALVQRVAALHGLQTLWRGDWIEARIVMELARLSFKSGDWRRGFLAMQTINRDFAEAPGARPLLDMATTQLEQIFDDKAGLSGSPVDAVALFMDFREFMPVGRRGDDVIRKLTDRLVDLDLLPQAAELMRYQLNNRLEGAARSLAAPRLAYVYVLDKRPKDALAVLNETRITGLSDDVQRARLLLEARALADLGDVAGAYERVETLGGHDVERLRAEIAWRAKDWKLAAEMSEQVIGDEWNAPEPFQNDAALYAIRAAIGYSLTADRLSLDRLRGRFLKNFGDRPDAAAFRFLTAPTAKQSPFESEYALSYKGGNAMDGFMRYYRDVYLDKTPTERQANAAPG